MKILLNTRHEEALEQAVPLFELCQTASPLRVRTTELFLYEDAIEFHEHKLTGMVIHRIRYADIAQVTTRERFANSALAVETRGGDKLSIRHVYKKPAKEAKRLINERIAREHVS